MTKKFYISALAIFVFSILPITAWSIGPEKVEFDKAANANIKKIALLGIHETRKITVQNIGGVSALGGMIGSAIKAVHNNDLAQKFVQAINDKKIRMGPPMAEAVKANLTQKGYEVIYLEKEYPKLASDGKSDDYSHIQTDADAILTVWFGVTGYRSPGASTDYKPWVLVFARLIDARTKNVLYYRHFKAGEGSPSFSIIDTEEVVIDDKYKFGSGDALLANVDEATEGIIACHRVVAAKIGEHLSK